MRCQVLLAEVCLELNDPPDPLRRTVVPDEQPAEERPGELERRQLEDVGRRVPYRGITVT
jgi:hypothetical protein